MLTFAKIFVVSCCLAAALTPLVRRVSVWVGLLDHPDVGRKIHTHPIPLGGGIVVLAGFLGTLAVMLLMSRAVASELFAVPTFTVGFVIASVGICLLGVCDDRFTIRGRQKLVGQLIVSSCVVGSGLLITDIRVFALDVDLGILAVPFTLFWILAAINAMNLIDGMDGLATSVGLVLSVGIAAMAVSTGHRVDAMLAMALAGSLAGFLFYNSPPASMFLGDAGSMLIGLVLGVLSIRSCLKGPATAVMAAPVALLAIPFFDVTMAILRRKLTGRSIYAADRSHFHHYLLQRGFSSRTTVLILGGLSCVMTVSAVLSVYRGNEWLATGAVLTVSALLVISGLFGRSECLLLLKRIKLVALSLTRLKREGHVATEISAQLRGEREWGDLWETLTVYAASCGLASIRLHLYVPELNEDFHASWQSDQRLSQTHLWTAEIPLVACGGPIGTLAIGGVLSHAQVSVSVSEVIQGLKPFETELVDLVESAVANTDDQEMQGRQPNWNGDWSRSLASRAGE
ncbi:MAG: MraY family glycosyltransferase [Planctomycetota bacterium]|nr:MraY family glycosyltransferase [Planctomycetota bacterium]